MKTLVSELEGRKLSYWVAKAQELEGYIGDISGDKFYILPNGSHVKEEDYRPDIDGCQAMELFELRNITGSWVYQDTNGEIHYCVSYGEEDFWCEATDLKIAICRAVVSSVYGKFVEERE